jgi:predicted nucleic acid-binding protein
VLALGRSGKIAIAVSLPIINEIGRVLHNKLLLENNAVKDVLREIMQFTSYVEPSVSVTVIKEKLADNRIIECALEAEAGFIISGDRKHLLPLKKYNGIRIMSPADFLKTFYTK